MMWSTNIRFQSLVVECRCRNSIMNTVKKTTCKRADEIINRPSLRTFATGTILMERRTEDRTLELCWRRDLQMSISSWQLFSPDYEWPAVSEHFMNEVFHLPGVETGHRKLPRLSSILMAQPSVPILSITMWRCCVIKKVTWLLRGTVRLKFVNHWRCPGIIYKKMGYPWCRERCQYCIVV